MSPSISSGLSSGFDGTATKCTGLKLSCFSIVKARGKLVEKDARVVYSKCRKKTPYRFRSQIRYQNMAGGNDRGKGKGRMSGQQEQEEEQRRRQLREAAERERIEEERQRIEREPIPEDIVNEFYNANMEVPNMEEFERWLDEEEDDDAGRPKRSAGRATGYHVQVQEPSGSVTKKTLTVQDAHNLPSGHRVKVDWSVFTRQPKGKGGQLFGRFCGNVGQNFQRFPIDALDWRKINDEQKNFAWNEIVKVD